MLSISDKKFIRRLYKKKYRALHQNYLIEGEKMLAEAMHAKAYVKNIYATKDWLLKNDEMLRLANISEVVEVSEKELSQISQFKTPNKVIAIAGFHTPEPALRFEKLSICLDGISDPGNMGTILRIADWFGINQVICSPDTVEIHNNKVVQASMGAIFRVNVFYRELDKFFEDYSDKYPLYIADLDGENIFDVQYELPAMLLLGNESAGINERYKKYAQKIVSIKGGGSAESLNVGVSCGIICAAMLR